MKEELLREDGSVTLEGMRTMALAKLIEFAGSTFNMWGVDQSTLAELRAAVRVAIMKIQSETEE